MQITSCKITNIKYVQIYLTNEELNLKETKEKIEEYKSKKCNVSIFVTGKENYPEILEKIITKQVDLNCNIC